VTSTRKCPVRIEYLYKLNRQFGHFSFTPWNPGEIWLITKSFPHGTNVALNGSETPLWKLTKELES